MRHSSEYSNLSNRKISRIERMQEKNIIASSCLQGYERYGESTSSTRNVIDHSFFFYIFMNCARGWTIWRGENALRKTKSNDLVWHVAWCMDLCPTNPWSFRSSRHLTVAMPSSCIYRVQRVWYMLICKRKSSHSRSHDCKWKIFNGKMTNCKSLRTLRYVRIYVANLRKKIPGKSQWENQVLSKILRYDKAFQLYFTFDRVIFPCLANIRERPCVRFVRTTLYIKALTCRRPPRARTEIALQPDVLCGLSACRCSADRLLFPRFYILLCTILARGVPSCARFSRLRNRKGKAYVRRNAGSTALLALLYSDASSSRWKAKLKWIASASAIERHQIKQLEDTERCRRLLGNFIFF